MSSHLDQTSLVNTGFMYGNRTLLSSETQQVILSGQDIVMLLARVANYSAGWFMLPLTELVI